MATQTSFLGLTKQDGTEKNHRPVINANYDIEDAFASGISEALAIVVNGNTAPQAIAAGQYLFIKNHSTLATGGYHAKSAISSGATISSSNVDPDADGIANSLYANLSYNNRRIVNTSTYGVGSFTFNFPPTMEFGIYMILISNGHFGFIQIHRNLDSNIAIYLYQGSLGGLSRDNQTDIVTVTDAAWNYASVVKIV